MLDLGYLEYCHPGSPFYERPAHEATDTDFDLVREPMPDGWSRQILEEWVYLAPTGYELPDQGWKVHVSTTLDDSPDTLRRCWSYCRDAGLPFKFVRGLSYLKRRNSKYGDRTASGKFVTVYAGDEDTLARVLHELGAGLDGRPGPYILSDLRWRGGPLYVRYGGFRMLTGRGPHGEPVACVRAPDGTLEPDVRRPGFRPPAWVGVPDVLTEAVAARRAGTLKNFPYRVRRALHFSNGGGVYEATDTRTGTPVLLKEARPLAGLDNDGRDAVERLRREHWALRRLADLPCVPGVLDLRQGNEHHFLVREFVDGAPLGRLVGERNPLMRGGTDVAGYTTWALDVFDRVAAGVAGMHERGVVFNDLHPSNILVTADDRLYFIDFETACAVSDGTAQAMGAPGFSAPAGVVGAAADRYALACVGLALFLPLTIIAAWGTEKAEQLLALVTDAFPVPAAFVERIRRDLGLDDVPAEDRRRALEAPPLWPGAADTGLRDALVRGILDAATPHRADRLYPGDIAQLRTPGAGTGWAHGAAGVQWALHRVGAGVPPAHRAWLSTAVDTAQAGPGFADGLCGLAYALGDLGRTDEALALLDRATKLPRDDLDASLADGLAGLGLTLLHFADTPDRHWIGEAERVAAELADFTARYAPYRPGLLHGPAGPALFLLRLYERTGERSLLVRAGEALTADVGMLGWPDQTGPWAMMSGLAGPMGTAMVVHDFLRHHDDATLRAALDDFRAAARTRFAAGAGWRSGRAGTVLGLLYTARGDADRAAVRRHLDDLSWHTVRQDGDNRAVLGEHGLKLSTDVATGTAGVLLALHAASTGAPTPVPFFDRAAGRA